MTPRRWTLDHLVAAVELVCGVVAAGWLAVLGAGSGSVLPFGLGLGVGGVLATVAVRRWRRADRAPGPTAARDTDRVAPPRPGPAPPRTPPVPLSPDGERELARVVGVLADAGVYAPRVPDPADLHGPVADHGEPVTAWAVLTALHEADHHIPGFNVAACSANLAFHDAQVEQLADTVRGQVDDLVRLAAGGLADVTAEVRLVERGDTASVPTAVRITGRGVEETITYEGAAKYLSTVVHVALARVLRERLTGRRFAWSWSDQGCWITALPDGAVERLNRALGPAAGEGWEWVDEQEPVAAGDAYRDGNAPSGPLPTR